MLGLLAVIRHDPPVPCGTTVLSLKVGPSVRSAGPPVQLGTGPRIDFFIFSDRGLDRSGLVRSRTEKCTPLHMELEVFDKLRSIPKYPCSIRIVIVVPYDNYIDS